MLVLKSQMQPRLKYLETYEEVMVGTKMKGTK